MNRKTKYDERLAAKYRRRAVLMAELRTTEHDILRLVEARDKLIHRRQTLAFILKTRKKPKRIELLRELRAGRTTP